jgi:hypothetical protein
VPAADRAGIETIRDQALLQTALRSERSFGDVTEANCWQQWNVLWAARTGSSGRSRVATNPGERENTASVFYDLSSSYLDGRCCPLATLGCRVLLRSRSAEISAARTSQVRPRANSSRRPRASRGSDNKPRTTVAAPAPESA